MASGALRVSAHVEKVSFLDEFYEQVHTAVALVSIAIGLVALGSLWDRRIVWAVGCLVVWTVRDMVLGGVVAAALGSTLRRTVLHAALFAAC